MSQIKIILFSIFFSVPVWSAEPLRTVIGENMSPPWYVVGPQGQPGGIISDYLKELEKQLNRDFEVLVLPKFRIREYYEKDKIDLNCYTTPEWAGATSKKLQWSNVLFTTKSMIVSNDGPVTSLKNLQGARVGTILKYHYPALQKKFDSGDLLRDDSTNEEANLRKLDSARFKFAMVDSVHLAFYLKNNPKSKINPQGYVTEEISVRCWVRKGSSLKIADLNRGIDELKSNGSLDRIFKKYR